MPARGELLLPPRLPWGNGGVWWSEGKFKGLEAHGAVPHSPSARHGTQGSHGYQLCPSPEPHTI